MADLMTATWEYEKLRTQYKGFVAPALSFTVGGKDLTKLGASLASFEAVLTMEGASSVSAVFNACYDVKNGTYSKELKGAAVLGKTVEVSLGYQSSLQKIFKGYLSNVRMNASAESGFSLEFIGLDARRLMMTDNCHSRELKIKNYSDAVSEILKRYAKLGTAKVDATGENFEDGLIWQNGSDYDFITMDLIGSGKADREFFIAADTIYFRKPRSVTAPVLSLRPGGGLAGFERDEEYLSRKYQVLGFDPAGGKAVSGKADAKTKGQMSDALGGPGEWYLPDPACVSQAQAGAMASALAGRALAKSQKARIRCVGLPELIPGRFLKVERLDSEANRNYYITQVTHSFDERGFTTLAECEGWT